jgi:hypothetical protein
MWLTDNDLRHLFRFGMAIQRADDPEDIPMRGLAKPHPENPDWFDLWVTDGANTVFARDVEPDGTGGYLNDRLGIAYRFFPVPESQKIVF